MRAIGLLLSLSLSLAGCFPHNARSRTLAKYAEGGALIGGIALEAAVNSGADCDATALPGMASDNAGCHTRATIAGDAGVALILAGLLGFVATVSTEPESAPPPPAPLASDRPATKPALRLPPGVQPSENAAR